MNKHLNEVASSMTENPTVVGPDTTLYDAHTKMIEEDIRRLPVVAKDMSLLGIITLSDIHKTVPLVLDDDTETVLLLNNQYVRQVMTQEPLFIAPDDSIQDAAEAMSEYKISGLPVVEGGRVVGIITESDIFRLIVESWGEMMPE